LPNGNDEKASVELLLHPRLVSALRFVKAFHRPFPLGVDSTMVVRTKKQQVGVEISLVDRKGCSPTGASGRARHDVRHLPKHSFGTDGRELDSAKRATSAGSTPQAMRVRWSNCHGPSL
jgi:hypothetical protein